MAEGSTKKKQVGTAVKSKLVKIQFYDPVIGYENLWAVPVTKRNFKIESIPFFVYGISRDDIVSAAQDKEGRLQFRKVIKHSQNRTLRARSDDFITNSSLKKRVIAALRGLGSDVEELRSRLLAINVPQNRCLESVTDYLTNKARINWEFGNPEDLNT